MEDDQASSLKEPGQYGDGNRVVQVKQPLEKKKNKKEKVREATTGNANRLSEKETSELENEVKETTDSTFTKKQKGSNKLTETPTVSFTQPRKHEISKRISLNTRKTVQRQGSVSQFMKEYMLTSGEKDVLFQDIPDHHHGTFQFVGYDDDSGGDSPFVKVPYKIHPVRVWEIMTEKWQCHTPNLIIAVTGGTKYFSILPKIKEKFQRGLVKAAATTGAWIITSGTNSGITEFVGKTVKDHVISSGGHTNIVTLGIAPWRLINKTEGLIKKVKGHTTQNCINYEKNQKPLKEKSSFSLDNNHTHFILVDDDTRGTDDVGFEIKFENFLSGTVQIPGARKETDGSHIPLIRILVDGGLVSLKTTLDSLKLNIPVIVLDGSGRAANLITDVLGKSDKLSESDIRNMVKLPEYNMFLEGNHVEQCVSVLKEIMKNKSCRQMINIFHVNEFETKDLDKVILESLLNARESNAIAKLLVSLAWNRCDIAEKQIFTPENREILKPELKNVMVMALIQNKHDFVRLLMEQGVDLYDFFNIKNLWNIYSNCLMNPTDKATSLLNNLLSFRQHTMSWHRHLKCCRQIDIVPDHRDLLIAIGDAVEYLLQDEVMNPYPHLALEEFQVDLKGCEMGYIEDDPDDQNSYQGPEVVKCNSCLGKQKPKKKKKLKDLPLFDGPEMQLFLWALLFNTIEMAKLFWTIVPRHRIVAAMLASAVLKAFNKYAKKEESFDLSESLRNHSSYFEQLACHVLSECYARDGDMAQRLLVQKVDCTTVLILAEDHHLTEFMGTPCVQQKLNSAWKGSIALYTSAWKILTCMFLPFLIFDMKFTKNGKVDNRVGTTEEFVDLKHKTDLFALKKDGTRRRKFYHVSLFGDKKGKTVSLGFALYYLYRAPVAIFMANVVSYLIYLGMFSYFVMTELSPGTPSVVEWLCYTWVFSNILEEMREISFKKQKSFTYKLYKWFGNEWNRFDLVLHTSFVLAVILRFSLQGDNFDWARVVYSITLTLSFMRFMEVFNAEERMGPKVIMIRKMLADLLFFILILALFVLGFGTAYQANLFPNAVKDWKLLKDVLYIPYFQIYGEIFLDNMEGSEPSTCTRNETQWRYEGATRCAESNAYVIIMLVIYMMLTNILLVNLVIAMFSHTFQKVQTDSKKLWRFHRFQLVHGYYTRPLLVPPLILLTHIFRFLRWMLVKYKTLRSWPNAFRVKYDDNETYFLSLFERDAAAEYMHQKTTVERQKIERKIDSTVDRIEQSSMHIESLRELVTRNEGIQKMQIQSNYEDIRQMKQQLNTITSILGRLEQLTELKKS